MAELIIHAGKLMGKVLVLPERELIVGRDESCHMKLTSNLVSRQHCTLIVGPEGIRVRDLGSQNGTYVNEVAITEPLLLQPGDILRIGAAVFRVPDAEPVVTKPKASKSDKRISDADIADWLTEDDSGSGPRGAGSTVIHGRAAIAASEVPAATAPSTPPPTPIPSAAVLARASAPKKPVFRTVKEEADEIIQNHLASLKPDPGESL
jgi:predicted component of type VI protein secretion system